MPPMSRLPGRSFKHFGWSTKRHQLWLAQDYLLCREISGFRETVTRYYYRDIQAILSGPTSAWRTCNWLGGSLLVFLSGAAIFAAMNGSTISYGLAVIAAVVVLGILLGNLFLGPSCKTTLYTAAAEAPLYSLGRRRGAEKAISVLLPFIQAAQRGRVVADLAETSPSEVTEPSPTEQSQTETTASLVSPVEVPPETGAAGEPPPE